MKIVGLIATILVVLAVTKALGLSEQAQLVGAVVGAVSFILTNTRR